MDTSDIVRCMGCGKPHRVYNYYCGSQTYCSECRKDLEKQADMSRDEWLEFKLDRFWY